MTCEYRKSEGKQLDLSGCYIWASAMGKGRGCEWHMLVVYNYNLNTNILFTSVLNGDSKPMPPTLSDLLQ